MVAPPALADFKTYLNKTSSSEDAELTHYLNAAQALAENRAGTFATTTRSETINCRGNGINLSYRPIVTVTSLTPLLNTWPSFATADVAWDARAGTVWRRDLGTLAGAWTVAYTAGWAGDIPENYWLATLIIGEHLWLTQRGSSAVPGRGGEEVGQIPGASYSMPWRAAQLLEDDGIFYGGIA